MVKIFGRFKNLATINRKHVKCQLREALCYIKIAALNKGEEECVDGAPNSREVQEQIAIVNRRQKIPVQENELRFDHAPQ
jgi:hypothetical protein